VILAEVLALRMLYLNTVQILGRGRELTTEDLKKLIERVDGEKQAMAWSGFPGRTATSQARKNEPKRGAFDRILEPCDGSRSQPFVGKEVRQ
jgi:3-deoxy-D-arabino-heptulosonate 7-phosphate (DAHP) synthase class II